MTRFARGRDSERGQILAVFALMFVLAVAAVGLVIDTGGAFATRRDAQTAADVAALAGANDYLINSDLTTAEATARTIATANGFTDAVGLDTVDVTITTSPLLAVTVDINTPHYNNFARIIPGQELWMVGVTATASSGVPDSAYGAFPLIFNIGLFDQSGLPKSEYTQANCPALNSDGFAGCQWGEANGDVPTTAGDFAWTDYGWPSQNVNTNDARHIIDGTTVADKTIALNEYIGQHNQGNHTALYSDVNSSPFKNKIIPVPVVDANGNFMGWASFKITGAVGGNDKHISGYFVGPYKNSALSVKTCAGSTCPNYLGTYVLKLTN